MVTIVSVPVTDTQHSTVLTAEEMVLPIDTQAVIIGYFSPAENNVKYKMNTAGTEKSYSRSHLLWHQKREGTTHSQSVIV